MKNNIDKDIKILEEFKNNKLERDRLERNPKSGFKIGYIYKFAELNPAISNVLSEFETLREISGELVIDNANLKIETETWRKIAEKLASKLNEAYFEQNDFWLFFEKEILKGIEADYGYVGDVIIDWARKEVEKDENSSSL